MFLLNSLILFSSEICMRCLTLHIKQTTTNRLFLFYKISPPPFSSKKQTNKKTKEIDFFFHLWKVFISVSYNHFSDCICLIICINSKELEAIVPNCQHQVAPWSLIFTTAYSIWIIIVIFDELTCKNHRSLTLH